MITEANESVHDNIEPKNNTIHGFSKIGEVLSNNALVVDGGELDYNKAMCSKLSDSVEFINFLNTIPETVDKSTMINTTIDDVLVKQIEHYTAINLYSLMNLTAVLAAQAPYDEVDGDSEFNSFTNAGDVFESNYDNWKSIIDDSLNQLVVIEDIPKDKPSIYAIYTMVNRTIRSFEIDAQITSLIMILIYLERHNITTIESIIDKAVELKQK